MTLEPRPRERPPRRAGEVFLAFSKLGVTSFGGPVAHLGYFRAELVERRRWIDDAAFGDLVAICQFLPGPTSSQVGFALGLARGGILGALAAFVAFTVPSAILMVALALGAGFTDGPVAAAILSGLKLVAVAIVAQAVLGMARTLAPDALRGVIVATAIALAVLLPGTWGQFAALAVGAVGGLALSRADHAPPPSGLRFGIPRAMGVAALAVFVVLLVGLPLLAAATRSPGLEVFDAFYRSGALVFGGGHVVLPLLHSAIVDPGWVGDDAFLAGYGAAQAIPGPLFTFAGYVGALVEPGPSGIVGALVGLAGIFLPGFLLLIGVLPFWETLSSRRAVRSAMRGANAAVVGILAAALYDPIFTSAVVGAPEFALAVILFICLTAARLPPWLVVVLGAFGGLAIGLATGFA